MKKQIQRGYMTFPRSFSQSSTELRINSFRYSSSPFRLFLSRHDWAVGSLPSHLPPLVVRLGVLSDPSMLGLCEHQSANDLGPRGWGMERDSRVMPVHGHFTFLSLIDTFLGNLSKQCCEVGVLTWLWTNLLGSVCLYMASSQRTGDGSGSFLCCWWEVPSYIPL